MTQSCSAPTVRKLDSLAIAAASAEQREYAEDVLRKHNVLKEKKGEEIRVLQDTVALLQAELEENGLKMPGSASEEDDV